jgi:uncharacterized cupin superfamily protein
VYGRLAMLESGPAGGEGIEAYHIEIDPGSSTGNDEYGHEGAELGLVVEGQADLVVGTARYRLEPGDSVSFASGFPHRLINISDKTLRVFWVVTPPKGAAPGRTR